MNAHFEHNVKRFKLKNRFYLFLYELNLNVNPFLKFTASECKLQICLNSEIYFFLLHNFRFKGFGWVRGKQISFGNDLQLLKTFKTHFDWKNTWRRTFLIWRYWNESCRIKLDSFKNFEKLKLSFEPKI